jgi:hypothetical protein
MKKPEGWELRDFINHLEKTKIKLAQPIFELYQGRTWANKINPELSNSYWPNAPAHWAFENLDNALNKATNEARYFHCDGGLVIVEFDGQTRRLRYEVKTQIVTDVKVV